MCVSTTIFFLNMNVDNSVILLPFDILISNLCIDLIRHAKMF